MANMKAAGVHPAAIHTVRISHFRPDHIYGLMEEGTNAPVFPNAEIIIVPAAEYKWWTEPGRVEKLPEARKALGARIQAGCARIFRRAVRGNWPVVARYIRKAVPAGLGRARRS
jgi:glyoxylase-like metal-dependent hydrolase (beta-lactamase superfamily II)